MRNENEAIGGRGLRVVAYYRMSDDEQRLSISQQQKEVRAFCAARGWVIVAEYIDKGKSGSKNIAARIEFHRLISDSAKGNWSAIVCYNSSRFGRLDAIDSAPYKSELRKHGIYLETVTEGRIDWRTSMGRIQDALLSEQNHNYSLQISESSTRGRADIADRGYWSVGEIPFGYDRQLVDDSGAIQMTLHRDKQFRKPRNWHTVLSVNQKESEIVRSVFERFANADISIRQLVKELNEDNVDSPGSNWSPQMLSRVLRDRAYIGTARIGFSRKSKEAHKRIMQQVKKNACPAIVDEVLFDRVQEKFKSRMSAPLTTQVRSGALSGILICGHCGFRMDKKERKNQVFYTCSSGTKRQHLGCKQWSVREGDILPILAEQLLNAVDAELLARLSQKPKRSNGTAEAQKKLIAKLETQYERARKNLLLADTDIFAALQKDTIELKAELDRQRNTLAVVEAEGAKDAVQKIAENWAQRKVALVPLTTVRKVADLEKIMPTMMTHLKTDHLQPFPSSTPAPDTAIITQYAERTAIRDLLKTLNATVTLHWTPNGRYFDLHTATVRAAIRGENVSNDRSSMNSQNILIIERTIRIRKVWADTDGRFRGRSPIRPAFAYAIAA